MFDEKILDSKIERMLKNPSIQFKVFDEKNCEQKQPYEDMEEFIAKNFYSKSINDHLFNQSYSFTKIDSNTPQQILIGDEALSLDESELYTHYHPLKNGYLNVS